MLLYSLLQMDQVTIVIS